MRNTKTPMCVIMATLLMVGALILKDQKVSAECSRSIPPLITHCANFMNKDAPKVPPSKDCCEVLRSVDIPCVCKFVNPKVEAIISMEKGAYVARTCGLKVEPGKKCGSYTVPASA
ncbi:uncharacterized protein [Euphorbia lathyris]|uniref:uncharacterized protein n=1 Tax=Euphorbia lathyris TaxID=212925 RepID=UPI0033133072